MVVTMVMVTAYCYGQGNAHMPRQSGYFLAIFQYGGRQRSIALPSGQETRLRVCGSHLAVRVKRAECRVNADVCGIVGKEESANLGAYRVCTPVRAKTARRKTQCWRGFAADSLAGLQKSAHEPLHPV